MKKFLFVLLTLILCVVVSCKSPTVKNSSEIVYEEAVLTPVSSADAYADISSEVIPEPVENLEVSESEMATEVEPEAVFEAEVEAEGEATAADVEIIADAETEVNSQAEADALIEQPTEDSEVSNESEPAVENSEVQVEAETQAPDVQVEPEVTVDTEEPIIVDVEEEETNKEVVLTNDVPEPFKEPTNEFPSAPNKVEEQVPEGFVDKAKFYGSKVLDFAKNNILLSLGFLSIFIGVLMLLIDLIKYIVKSIKFNRYDEEDFEFEEDFDLSDSDDSDSLKSKKRTKEVKSSNNTDAKFQDEDDFLKSLLDDEDL